MKNLTVRIDAEQIAEWLKVLIEPDSTAEMRVLYASDPAHVQHYASTDLMRMAQDAVQIGRAHV